MEITVLNEARKKVYRITNVSLYTFAILFILSSILFYFSNNTVKLIASYLIISGVLAFAIGLVGFVRLLFLNKRSITIDPNISDIELDLNYRGDKFGKVKLKFLGPTGNILKINFEGFIREYEISSSQVKLLATPDLPERWKLTYQRKKTNWLEESPKTVLKDLSSLRFD